MDWMRYRFESLCRIIVIYFSLCLSLFTRLMALFLEPSAQWYVMVVGFIILGIPLIFFPNYSSVFVGVGSSMMASALVAKALNKKESVHEGNGIIFAGDKDGFNKYYGWDQWLGETRRSGEIIIVGRDHEGWIANSLPMLVNVTSKGINVRFIFLRRSSANPGKIIDQFRRAGATSQGEYLSFFVLKEEAGADFDNMGIYWNGRLFLVKMYIAGVPKEESPIIGFDVSMASPRFDIRDFIGDAGYLPFKDPAVLSKCAQALANVLDNSEPIQ